jgi:hypothetical protein
MSPSKKLSSVSTELNQMKKSSNGTSKIKPDNHSSNENTELNQTKKSSNGTSKIKPDNHSSNENTELNQTKKSSNGTNKIKPDNHSSNENTELNQTKKSSNGTSKIKPDNHSSNVSHQMIPPTVVRLKRSKGEIVQGCDVYIGRAMCMGGWQLSTSPWHNPFKIDNANPDSRNQVITQYEEYLRNNQELQAKLVDLSGKVLGCWCKPDACHGDIIVKHFCEKFVLRG